MNHKDEITVQLNALSELSHGNNKMVDQVLCLKPFIAVTFRAVINQFEIERGRVPEPGELIWLTSELLDYDIRKLFEGGKQ